MSMRAANLRIGKRGKSVVDVTAFELAAEIRRYCDAHPHARDSIDGIAWWLTWERFNKTKKSLQGAIDQLIARGVLQSHRLNDGSVVFGCAGDCAGANDSVKRGKAKLTTTKRRKTQVVTRPGVTRARR